MTSVPDFSQRRAYARSVVLRLGLDEYGPEYQALIGGRPAGQSPGRGQGAAPLAQPQARVECEALKFALQHPDWTAEAAERFWAPDWFSTPGTLAAFAALSEAGGPASRWRRSARPPPPRPTATPCRAWPSRRSRPRENRGYADEVFRRLEGAPASPVSSTSSRGHCGV